MRRASAATAEARAQSTLAWLRALRDVLSAIPIGRASGPHTAWLERHGDLLIYSEPAGEWLIRNDLLRKLHDEHANTAAADEIAWLAVTNGLAGECEGHLPCYASSLNRLEGYYLREHPRGAHRQEVLDSIAGSLRVVSDDRRQPQDRSDSPLVSLSDCGDLLESMRPLRAAIAAAGGGKTEALVLADRLIAQCPR